MTRSEHLLTVLAEECCEVGQRVSKALRFGLAEVQPDQEGYPYRNDERVMHEVADFLGVLDMPQEEGVLPMMSSMEGFRDRIQAKKAKVEKFIVYAGVQE